LRYAFRGTEIAKNNSIVQYTIRINRKKKMTFLYFFKYLIYIFYSRKKKFYYTTKIGFAPN